MGRTPAIETRKDRSALARDAGLGSVSLVSVIAGVLTAYGAVAILAALAGGILSAVGVDTDFTNEEWRQVGVGGAVVLGLVLLVSYLFGGYVAGRMARRSGVMNGLLVFLVGVLLIAAVGGIVGAFGDTESILADLRDLGVPTTADQWADIGTIAGIATLVAMLAGALLGGVLGERWHTKLLSRAVDPAYGPTAHDHDHDTRDDRDHDGRDDGGDHTTVHGRGDGTGHATTHDAPTHVEGDSPEIDLRGDRREHADHDVDRDREGVAAARTGGGADGDRPATVRTHDLDGVHERPRTS